jgi:hypothetical protein
MDLYNKNKNNEILAKIPSARGPPAHNITSHEGALPRHVSCSRQATKRLATQGSDKGSERGGSQRVAAAKQQERPVPAAPLRRRCS